MSEEIGDFSIENGYANYKSYQAAEESVTVSISWEFYDNKVKSVWGASLPMIEETSNSAKREQIVYTAPT